MQKLHLVGFTTDHRALILSVRRGARTGGYVLELDDAVTASVADALARRAAALEAEPAAEPTPVPQPVERPESALTVRELQSRLRAGRTVEDVAAEAGVEPEWVARFAPPVVAEQGRVIEATKAARLERSPARAHPGCPSARRCTATWSSVASGRPPTSSTGAGRPARAPTAGGSSP